jgi:hypothetical protein
VIEGDVYGTKEDAYKTVQGQGRAAGGKEPWAVGATAWTKRWGDL